MQLDRMALVQTRAESAMMDKCHDSFLSKSCLKVGTLTRRSWCYASWYLSFKLSYRDLVAIMGERAIFLAHSTILRWVQHYTPGVRETMETLCPAGGWLLAV